MAMEIPQTFNTNLVHNILNAAGWIIGLIGVILVYSGCTALPSGSFDCSSSDVIPPWLLPYILILTTLMSFSKTIMNLGRDGFHGLFKVQPPVADKMVTVNVPAPKGARVTVAKVKTNVSQKARQ